MMHHGRLNKTKILNLYGQEAWHTDARIVGNRQGLEALNRTILRALVEKKATTGEEREPLYASDGEGYEVIVEMNNQHWGLKEGVLVDSYWNRDESKPQYLILERQQI